MDLKMIRKEVTIKEAKAFCVSCAILPEVLGQLTKLSGHSPKPVQERDVLTHCHQEQRPVGPNG